MPLFQPGESGNAAGKRPGTLNKSTGEVRQLAKQLVTSRRYLAALKRRLLAGELAPPVESLLWAYAWGRPALRVQVDAPKAPRGLAIHDTTNGQLLAYESWGLGSFALNEDGTSYSFKPSGPPVVFTRAPEPDVDDGDDDAA